MNREKQGSSGPIKGQRRVSKHQAEEGEADVWWGIFNPQK